MKFTRIGTLYHNDEMLQRVVRIRPEVYRGSKCFLHMGSRDEEPGEVAICDTSADDAMHRISNMWKEKWGEQSEIFTNFGGVYLNQEVMDQIHRLEPMEAEKCKAVLRENGPEKERSFVLDTSAAAAAKAIDHALNAEDREEYADVPERFVDVGGVQFTQMNLWEVTAVGPWNGAEDTEAKVYVKKPGEKGMDVLHVYLPAEEAMAKIAEAGK